MRGNHASDVALPTDADMRSAVEAEPSNNDLVNHNTPAFRAIPEEAMKLAKATEIMSVLK